MIPYRDRLPDGWRWEEIEPECFCAQWISQGSRREEGHPRYGTYPAAVVSKRNVSRKGATVAGGPVPKEVEAATLRRAYNRGWLTVDELNKLLVDLAAREASSPVPTKSQVRRRR